jgi:inhibitor of cysteine peptidase
MDENKTESQIKVGEKLTLNLESNPTTGYFWFAIFDENFLSLVSKDYVPTTNLIGAGGVERFIFIALKQGETSIKMLYSRNWKKKINI